MKATKYNTGMRSLIQLRNRLNNSPMKLRNCLEVKKMKFPEDVQKAIEDYYSQKARCSYRKRKIPPRGVLEELYWDYELSLPKIARVFGVHHSAVHRWLGKYKIRIRDRTEASIKSITKFAKKLFSGNLEEKAYLIGFRLGDLHARRTRRQIEVTVMSTIPSMRVLMHDLFSQYTTVVESPHKDKEGYNPYGYCWRIYCYLDRSFEFLLPIKVPRWILDNDTYFYAFLAGFFDAEGSIIITHHDRRYIDIVLKITNSRKKLLCTIRDKLTRLGYHSYIKPAQTTYNLVISRKHEAIDLLSKLPIRHNARVRKYRLAMEIVNKRIKYWNEIEDKVEALNSQLEEEKRRYVQQAKEEWLRRHRATCLVDA
jgi:hypothetical protein